PGAGSYDLYLIYSLKEEQDTLAFVQRVILGGGAVLLALIVGIAIVVARMVTTPLRKAALAAARMAAGDLTSRVEVAGADGLARAGEPCAPMPRSPAPKVADPTELPHAHHRVDPEPPPRPATPP